MDSLQRSLSLVHCPKSFLFATGHSFRGLTIVEIPEGYRVIIRSYTRTSDPVYALTEGVDPVELLANLVAALTGRQGANMWRVDQYANGRRQSVG